MIAKPIKIFLISVLVFCVIGIYIYHSSNYNSITIPKTHSGVMIKNAENLSHYVFFHYNSDIQDTINKLMQEPHHSYGSPVSQQWDYQIIFGCHFVIGKDSAYFLPDERPVITVQLYKQYLSIDGTELMLDDYIAYSQLYDLVAGMYSSRLQENNGYY